MTNAPDVISSHLFKRNTPAHPVAELASLVTDHPGHEASSDWNPHDFIPCAIIFSDKLLNGLDAALSLVTASQVTVHRGYLRLVEGAQKPISTDLLSLLPFDPLVVRQPKLCITSRRSHLVLYQRLPGNYVTRRAQATGYWHARRDMVTVQRKGGEALRTKRVLAVSVHPSACPVYRNTD